MLTIRLSFATTGGKLRTMTLHNEVRKRQRSHILIHMVQVLKSATDREDCLVSLQFQNIYKQSVLRGCFIFRSEY